MYITGVRDGIGFSTIGVAHNILSVFNTEMSLVQFCPLPLT